jgi:putative copper resistance protein D
MPDLFGLAAIVTKFALYIGVITAAGTVMATLMFRLDRTRGLAAAFAVLGLVATIFTFSLRGANLTGDARGMTNPEMLGLLWATPVGTAFQVTSFGPQSANSGSAHGARWDLGLGVGWCYCNLVFQSRRTHL